MWLLINKKQLLLLSLFATLAIAGTASAAVSGGFPPQLGRLCGSVSGASWRFQGHTGTRYNVIAKTAAMCRAGMKSVSGLTRETAHAGAFGAHTLTGPQGFRCVLTLAPAHTGFCGRNSSNSVFFWAPRLTH
ncbi:MAG TPA: hypothetical protein VGU02_10570 [Gaiellaceae bacterium]|nr:hypothetical protein [Gaiellaceae bacterium]